MWSQCHHTSVELRHYLKKLCGSIVITHVMKACNDNLPGEEKNYFQFLSTTKIKLLTVLNDIILDSYSAFVILPIA